MGSIYENPEFILSTVASEENISQNKGIYINDKESDREVKSSKWTKVLLMVFSVCLVFAVGGLCVLGALYIRALTQLSAQETSSTPMMKELTANYTRVLDYLRNKDSMMKELTTNYTRVLDYLRNKDTMLKELTANNNRVKEQLSFYEGFTAESSNCGENFKAFQGKRYFFSCDKLTWSSSRAFCVSKGADLVTITSQSEQNFLTSKMTETCWLGLSDLETEGRWVWVNKQTLYETGVQFWANRNPPEPDNWRYEDPSGENCASVGDEHGNLPEWFDSSCKKLKKFICEKKF